MKRLKVFVHLVTTGKILSGEIDRQGKFYREGFEPIDVGDLHPCLVSSEILSANEIHAIWKGCIDDVT